MADETTRAEVQEQSFLVILLGSFAIIACVVFTASILIADVVVPDHDWIADTISDLGAGKYEFIVDIGLYTFSAALIGLAILSSHVHLGDWRWSVGILALAVFGLLVFIIGARNEYGDNDSEGWVLHIYFVYGLGLAMAVVNFTMADGAAKAGKLYGRVLLWTGIVWVASAPVFFFLPTDVDGLYERYLGGLSFITVITLAWLFIARGRDIRAGDTV